MVEAVFSLLGAGGRNNHTSSADWLRKNNVVMVNESFDQFKMTWQQDVMSAQDNPNLVYV